MIESLRHPSPSHAQHPISHRYLNSGVQRRHMGPTTSSRTSTSSSTATTRVSAPEPPGNYQDRLDFDLPSGSYAQLPKKYTPQQEQTFNPYGLGASHMIPPEMDDPDDMEPDADAAVIVAVTPIPIQQQQQQRQQSPQRRPRTPKQQQRVFFAEQKKEKADSSIIRGAQLLRRQLLEKSGTNNLLDVATMQDNQKHHERQIQQQQNELQFQIQQLQQIQERYQQPNRNAVEEHDTGANNNNDNNAWNTQITTAFDRAAFRPRTFQEQELEFMNLRLPEGGSIKSDGSISTLTSPHFVPPIQQQRLPSPRHKHSFGGAPVSPDFGDPEVEDFESDESSYDDDEHPTLEPILEQQELEDLEELENDSDFMRATRQKLQHGGGVQLFPSQQLNDGRGLDQDEQWQAALTHPPASSMEGVISDTARLTRAAPNSSTPPPAMQQQPLGSLSLSLSEEQLATPMVVTPPRQGFTQSRISAFADCAPTSDPLAFLTKKGHDDNNGSTYIGKWIQPIVSNGESMCSMYDDEVNDSTTPTSQAQNYQCPFMATVLSPVGPRYIRLVRSDQGFGHALRAGSAWQSLASQHVRFPKTWWNGARYPPLGVPPSSNQLEQVSRQRSGTSISEASSSSSSAFGNNSSGWKYFGRHRVGGNSVLNDQFVKSRGSAGRILLHIIVRDMMTLEPVQDIAIGVLHPNARGVRPANQAHNPTWETCRDVWMALRTRDASISNDTNRGSRISVLESIVAARATHDSPLGPRKAVDNTNMRVIFGELPPAQTLFLLENDLFELLSDKGKQNMKENGAPPSMPPALVLLETYLKP